MSTNSGVKQTFDCVALYLYQRLTCALHTNLFN